MGDGVKTDKSELGCAPDIEVCPPQDERPNILLLMTDQHRGDALGCEGHPVLQTPYLDALAEGGVRFSHAYSACPQCIPARRTLMTGMSAHGHGVYNNYDTVLTLPTLPELLTKAGYQTHLSGKLHLYPQRKLYGFMSADWADAPHENMDGDYGIWLRSQGFDVPEVGMAHGCHYNGWNARPFHLEERFHFSNWVTDRALQFMERRDPTVPFFLKVSYHQPHQPCTPPQCYWDRYIDDPNLPMPVVGEWSKTQNEAMRGLEVASWKTVLPEKQMRQYRAGYFGCINHIDDQIGRLLRRMPKNTVVIFTSDHGEMLGDHEWIRKTRGLEASARIPFLMNFPKHMGVASSQVRSEVVELRDIMPTCLDIAEQPTDLKFDGQSLLPLLKGESSSWRQHIHGECATLGGEAGSTQWVSDGKRKFIWDPACRRQLFFDLEQDPSECRNLIDDPARAQEVKHYRQCLIENLRGRPEGFVKDDQLCENPEVRVAHAALIR